MTITPEELNHARDLYERGLYLAAYRLTDRHGRLQDWPGTRARLFAGRLAAQLGALRLGQAIHLRAWRAAPEHLVAQTYAGFAITHRRGPWEGWKFCRRFDDLRDGSAQDRSLALTLRAHVLILIRDFVSAEACISDAEDLTPDEPWPHIIRTDLLHQQDRSEECLASARRALALRPTYPQATIAEAQALIALGRDDEALERLREADRNSESGRVALLLTGLLVANRDHRDALAGLDRVVELSPLMDKSLAQHIASQRADAHYLCGESERAIEAARQVDTEFYRRMIQRLESGHDGKRVVHDVDFVRQHHLTCAPATLTSISKFWSRDAEHVEVAEEICYDGTPAHSERNWATSNGWSVREFTVTSDSAMALLDRGAPFTLTTIGPTDGHLQAVIGYDALRETLVVRDPSFRNEVEYLTHDLLEGARATGPRGMALVPADRAELLEDLELPDAEMWDRSHAVQNALAEHDRDRAHEVYRSMSEIDSEHLLTQYARRGLAAYDADPVGLLAFAESMLQRFPQNPRLLLSRLSYLSELGRENECLEHLDEACRDPRCHPSLQLAYAAELARDSRRHDDALRILRRLLRIGYLDARCLRTLGDLEWSAERFDDALQAYRFAACLSDKDENLAMMYFSAACWLNRSEEGERFLEQRARQLGGQSPAALITLCQAFWQRGQLTRAVETLDEALRLHPEDAELLITASGFQGLAGQLDRAEAALRSAEPRAKRSDWLRASARLAERRGDLRHAVELLRQVLELEPLAPDANRERTRLLGVVEGSRIANEHLDAVCARFPHNLTLQRLRVEWLIDHDRDAAEPALREMIEASSVNPWQRIRLAQLLGERGEFPEAFAEAELAALLDPSDAACQSVRGRLFTLAGKRAEAAEAFRNAIRLSVAMDSAIHGLLAVCCSDDERRDALELVRSEILRQLSAGEAPSLYQGFARGLVEPEALLQSLEALRETRPDHRQCWSTTIRQLLSMDRLDQALRLGEKYVERFPRVIEAWLEVGRIRSVANDVAGEKQALRRILQIDPGFGQAHRRLSEIAQRELPKLAKQLLEDAIVASPLDAMNHGWLAELLWDSAEHEAALTAIEAALVLAPDYGWAWSALRGWSAERDQPDRAVNFARGLTERRAGEVSVWIKLSEMLSENREVEPSLDAVRRAMELDPRSIEAHDRHATLLAEAEKFEEALQACRPVAWPDEPPLPLRGRTAWVEAARGNVLGAARQMTSILEAAPDYIWGWRQLTEWHRNSGNADAYLQAATRVARLTPDDAVSLGILGHAMLLNDDVQGAKSEFHRAFELAPTYTFAGRELFDLQIDGGELDVAARTLGRLSPQITEASAAALKLTLDSAHGNRVTVVEELGLLCRMPGVEEDELQDAVSAAFTNWPDEVADVLEELLGQDGAHPLIGAMWIQSRPEVGLWKGVLRRLDELEPGCRFKQRALKQFLERLGESDQPRRVKQLLCRYGEELRRDTSLWGAAAYSLARLGLWNPLLLWTEDWRGREDIEAWMLANVVTALRNAGRDVEAYEAGMRACMLEPDGSWDRHHAWLAVEEALRGETAVAEVWLTRMGFCKPGSWESFLALLARAVMASASEDDGPMRFTQARRLLGQASGQFTDFRRRPALKAIYRRCMREIARRQGGVAGTYWRLRSIRG